MPPIDIDPTDLKLVQEIFLQYIPNNEVWAFGSRVRGNAKKFSDLDLAIVGEEPIPSSVLADLGEAFDESTLPFKVDLVDWATTSDAFRKIIAQHYVVIQAGQESHK